MNITSPSSTSSSGVDEQVSPGLTREWLCDKRVVVYTLANVHRSTIDTWIDAFKADILNWPADQTYLVMHDFSTKKVDATPYGRHRAEELLWLRRELKGRAAIVLPHTIAAALIQVFVRIAQTKGTPRVQQVFTSRDAALKWLLS